MEKRRRQQCLTIALFVLVAVFLVSLALTIGFGVGSGGDGCACRGDKCCVSGSFLCDECICQTGHNEEDEEWNVFCEKRNPMYGAFIAFLVFSIVTFLSMSIISCVICCPCCQPTEVIVANGAAVGVPTPNPQNAVPQQPQYGQPVAAVARPPNSDVYERQVAKV